MKRTACGLDVHKDSVFCCILCKDGRKVQHKLGVLTEELMTLRDLMESDFTFKALAMASGTKHPVASVELLGHGAVDFQQKRDGMTVSP